jgi:hypothetical protein
MSAIEIVGTVVEAGSVVADAAQVAGEATKLGVATAAVAKYAQTGANIAKCHPVAAAVVGAAAAAAAVYGSYKMFKGFTNKKAKAA